MYVSIVLCILSRLLRVCIHVNCDLSSFVYVCTCDDDVHACIVICTYMYMYMYYVCTCSCHVQYIVHVHRCHNLLHTCTVHVLISPLDWRTSVSGVSVKCWISFDATNLLQKMTSLMCWYAGFNFVFSCNFSKPHPPCACVVMYMYSPWLLALLVLGRTTYMYMYTVL